MVDTGSARGKGIARSHVAALALLTVLGLGLRLWGINFGMPGMWYWPDENMHILPAYFMDRSDLNPHDFLHPSLFKYLLYIEYRVAYIAGNVLGFFSSAQEFRDSFWRDPSLFYLLGRITSALFGAATIPLVYFLGRRLFSPTAGLLAALFAATMFVNVEYSHYAEVDVPAAFQIVLATYLCLPVQEKGRWRDFVLAGAAAGLATGMNYTGLILVVPLGVAAVSRMLGKDGLGRGGPVVSPVVRIIGAGLVWLMVFIATNPYAILDFDAFWRDFRFQSQVGRAGFTLGIFEVPKAGEGYGYYITSLWFSIGAVLAALILIGILRALLRRRRQDLLVLSVPAVMYLFLGSQRHFEYEYMMPGLLLLLPFAANAVASIAVRIQMPFRPVQATLVAMGVLAIIQPLAASITSDRLLGGDDTRTKSRQWILQNVPDGTRLAMDHNGLGRVIYNGQEVAGVGGAYRAEIWEPAEFKNAVSAGGRYWVRLNWEGYNLKTITLEDYRREGIQYIISNGPLWANRYSDSERKRTALAFYGQLSREASLVAEFVNPRISDPGPFYPFSARLMGPTVQIYYLPFASPPRPSP